MTERYRPNTTVAWVIKSPKGYLFVEEFKHGQQVYNQPAGHIEAGESIIEAGIRELAEETSLQAEPQGLVGIYHFPNHDGPISYIRYCFYLELEEAPKLIPQDSDITACHWLTREQLLRRPLRSPFVLKCLDDFDAGERYPLTVLKSDL